MNPRLVMCMFVSALLGGCFAVAAVVAGWSLIVALPLFSLTGSFTLVVISLLSIPPETPEPQFYARPATEPHGGPRRAAHA